MICYSRLNFAKTKFKLQGRASDTTHIPIFLLH
jgi:hypothetical protein